MINKFPYTDFHEINLDWILAQIKSLHHSYDEFKALNTITNAGAWDITKQYQAWTVVSDNNVGYISVRPVPAGIAITNTDYWALIADYDILITDLSSRISALENSVNNVLTPAVSGLNTRVSNLENERFIFVCDSYGQTTSLSGTAYPEVIKQTLGLGTDEFYITAYGGASWKGLNGRPSFKEVLQLIENTVYDPASIDYIYVLGGVNDAVGTMSNVYQGASDFMDYVKVQYPNAKVITGMIGWNTDPTTMYNIKTVSYPAYNNLGAYGIGVMNNAETMMHDYRYFQADGTHPNANGNYALAYGILSFIKSGNIAANGRGAESVTVTLNSTKFQGGTLRFTEYKTNNAVRVSWANSDLQLASGQTIGFEENVVLGTIDNIFWKNGGDPFAACIEVITCFIWNDGTYHSETVPGVLFNDNGTLKLQVKASNSLNNIPGLIYLSIYGGTKVFNTIDC